MSELTDEYKQKTSAVCLKILGEHFNFSAENAFGILVEVIYLSGHKFEYFRTINSILKNNSQLHIGVKKAEKFMESLDRAIIEFGKKRHHLNHKKPPHL